MNPSFRATEENLSCIYSWVKANKIYMHGFDEDFEFKAENENLVDEFCCAGSTRILEFMVWIYPASVSDESIAVKFLPFWIVGKKEKRPNYRAADHLYKSFAVDFVKALYTEQAPKATMKLMLKLRDNFVCFPRKSQPLVSLLKVVQSLNQSAETLKLKATAVSKVKYQKESAHFKDKKNWLRVSVNAEVARLTCEKIVPRINQAVTKLSPLDGGDIEYDHMPEHGKWTNGERFGKERTLREPLCLEVKLHAADALQEICANNKTIALNVDKVYYQFKAFCLSKVEAALTTDDLMRHMIVTIRDRLATRKKTLFGTYEHRIILPAGDYKK